MKTSVYPSSPFYLWSEAGHSEAFLNYFNLYLSVYAHVKDWKLVIFSWTKNNEHLTHLRRKNFSCQDWCWRVTEHHEPCMFKLLRCKGSGGVAGLSWSRHQNTQAVTWDKSFEFSASISTCKVGNIEHLGLFQLSPCALHLIQTFHSTQLVTSEHFNIGTFLKLDW